MANFINKFFFGDEDEQQNGQTVASNEQPVSTQSVSPVTIPTTEPNVSGVVNNDMIASIWGAVKSNSQEGPDYNTLKEIANTLIGIVPDETMRLQGAFNVLKGKYSGLTKKNIIDSIDNCISVVDGQKKIGLEQCEEKKVSEVDGKLAQIASINEQAADILKEIEEKKAKYDELTKQTRALENEAQNAETEINQQKVIFINSIQSVLNQLNSDKAKVSNLSV